MRNRIIAAVLLAGIIVGAIFIIKGCKKDDAPVDEDQNQPAVDAVEQVDDQPKVDDELLTLVNPWNPLPDSWTPDLVTLSDGRKIDSRCYEAFEEMMDACKAAGYSPFLCSAYRTQETQQGLYDNKVQRLVDSGMSEEEAKVEAAKAVAIPGTSEHQLGLAVDIVDANMQDLTDEQENTATQKWLMANSWRYGFIHRYPNGKTDITGIIYEPWHYRYVGKDAAQEIFNRDITLEEYLGKAEH
ncbi:MAG: M15 family metallopeptidase [Oscillospiraceae bacterium]|nr:M15 family metallopeptidase [Oscillospiraceae bacterium]